MIKNFVELVLSSQDWFHLQGFFKVRQSDDEMENGVTLKFIGESYVRTSQLIYKEGNSIDHLALKYHLKKKKGLH